MITTFRMEDQNISMIRGDTLAFNLVLYDENGELYTEDLTDAYFTCKSNKIDDRYAFIKTLANENGITKVKDGVYLIKVAPEDTRSLEAGRYFYDLQVGMNDDVFTVMHGVLEIEQDVTYSFVKPMENPQFPEMVEITEKEIDKMFE